MVTKWLRNNLPSEARFVAHCRRKIFLILRSNFSVLRCKVWVNNAFFISFLKFVRIRNSGMFKLKHFNELCFHMPTPKCPDEQNVIDRSGSEWPECSCVPESRNQSRYTFVLRVGAHQRWVSWKLQLVGGI